MSTCPSYYLSCACSPGRPLQLKNGQDISKLLPQAYLRDRKDNRHHTLPEGFDLSMVPQLQLSPGQIPESNQSAPCFARSREPLLSIISGVWSFGASTGLLSLSEVAIVGTPGPVTLTLSGGANSAGTPLQSATLHAQLMAGPLAKDKLGVSHWPPGVCCLPQSACLHPVLL